jgi:hypothetical protein
LASRKGVEQPYHRLVERSTLNKHLEMDPPIPLIYQFVFLYFEPVMAFFGSIILLTQPTTFLNTMSPTATVASSNKVIYDQLGATYALFAWNEAVLLRLIGRTQTATTIRLWKAILLGILICDLVHLYGSWDALGADVFWNASRWRWEDWVNLGSLWGQGAVRVAFLLDVGLQKRALEVKAE